MGKKFKDPLDNEEPFQFPDSVLHEINQCSAGGFLLFFLDQYGAPQVRASFDNPIIEMGLRSYATKFLKGVNSLEESGITENLTKENNDEETEGE